MKLLFLFLCLTSISFGQMGLGTLKGTVVDGNNEPLPFTRIIVYSLGENRSFMAGVESDFDGKFLISSLSVGVYDIELTNMSFVMDTLIIENVEILPETITFLDSVEMTQTIRYHSGCLCIPEYPNEVRLNIDPFGRSTIIDPEDIRRH